MNTPKTTLVAGAPWPMAAMAETLNKASAALQALAPEPVRAAPVPLPEKKHYTPKAIKPEVKAALRNYLTVNPGQKITAISKGLGWSLSHTEKVLTEIRTEVGNGHFLKSSLIRYFEVKEVTR